MKKLLKKVWSFFKKEEPTPIRPTDNEIIVNTEKLWEDLAVTMNQLVAQRCAELEEIRSL